MFPSNLVNCSCYLQFTAVKFHMQWITAVQTKLQYMYIHYIFIAKLSSVSHFSFEISYSKFKKFRINKTENPLSLKTTQKTDQLLSNY